jgi:WD40 repeat protein
VLSEDLPAHLAGFRQGSVVAGYRLEAQAGAGGMAVVFRARDERLGRLVALKLLAPRLAADAAFRQRFIRESRAAAAVDDPHIIPVYDAGEAGGVLFLAMRYVPGGDVRSLLARAGPLPSARAAAIISPVASALDAAHAAGLVHRDVKPANMLVDVRPDRPDHVYLSDFGLSKGALSSAGVTGIGYFLGTANYAAPEQIQGEGVDGRADQYALACAAFELLAGEAPFQRDQGMAVLLAHLSQPPPSAAARRPGLPSAVDEVFARALAKAPQDRYASCLQFADALRDALGLAAYHFGSGDALAADPPAVGHPGTEIDWPAAPAALGTAIAAATATASTPDRALGGPGPVVVAEGAFMPTVTGRGPGFVQGQEASRGKRRRGRRPGRAALAGISIVAVGGAAAAVILASSPSPDSANVRGHESASSRAHISPGSRGHGSTSSPGQVPALYHLAGTLADPYPGTLGVLSVAFSPDGKTLATADNNGSSYLWDLATGTRTETLGALDASLNGVHSVAFSPDGRMLATGNGTGSTYLWDVATGTRTAVLIGPNSAEVLSLAFSPDGKTLAIGDASGSIYLWDVSTATLIAVLTAPPSVGNPKFGGQNPVTSVAFSPDGKTLATGCTDGLTYLWNVTTRTRSAALVGPVSANLNGVDSVAFSPDGKTLATSYYTSSIYLWNVATRTRIAVLTDPGAPAQGVGVQSVAFSPDGKTLATADYNGSTYLWDVASRTRIVVLTNPDKNFVCANSVAFSPDGKTLAVGDLNGSTTLWDAG